MKREWELSEGEKKGRSSREAKRSSPPSTPSLSSASSSPPNPPPPIKIDTCRKRPQATVQPSWREASENKVENENGPNEQKRCFFFSLFFQRQCQSGRGDWGGDQSWVPGIKCGRGGLGEKGILNVGGILYQFCNKCERAGPEKGEFWSLSEFSQPGCKTSSPRKTQRQGAGKVGTLMLWHLENIIWNIIWNVIDDWVFDTTG